MANLLNLPPGFRFKPSDEELITYYLKPKVMGLRLPCNIIKNDIQLYSPNSTPWLLFDIDNPDSWVDSNTDNEKSLYLFTSLSNVSADPNNNTTATRTRCNTSKRAGCGTWLQKSKPAMIHDRDGNLIGWRRMFIFEINDAGYEYDPSKAVYFKMHEYSLNENLGCNAAHLVLCKITFDSSKKSPVKVATKANHHVSTTGSKAQKKRQTEKNLESKSGILQESRSLISESLVVTDDGVSTVMTSDTLQKSLVVIEGAAGTDDGSVLDLDEFCEGLSPDDLGGEGLVSDDRGGDDLLLDSFDIDGFMQYQEEPLEEGENLCQSQAKKM